MMKIATLIIFTIVSLFGISQTGSTLFDDSYVHSIHIESSNTSIYSQLENDHSNYLFSGGAKVYREVTMTIDGVQLPELVGIRFKGETSFTQVGEKKPMKIDINKIVSEQKYEGLKKFNLHNNRSDASVIREKLVYDIMRQNGVKAPRVSFTKVYLNNEYWGLYTVVEQIDKTFLNESFGNKNGNLYKSPSSSHYLGWPISGQPVSSSDTLSLVAGMLLKTNKTNPKWDGLVDFLDVINNSSQSGNGISDLFEAFNLEDYLTILATEVCLLDIDSYWQSGKNFYLYENTDSDKMEWVPWDYNLALNTIFDGSTFDPDYKEIIDNPLFNDKPLLTTLFSESALRDSYLNKVCALFENSLDSTVLFPMIDSWKALIQDDVYADAKKNYSNADFDNNISYGEFYDFSLPNPIPGIKSILKDRIELIEATLQNLNFTCTVGFEENELEQVFTVYPNPSANGTFQLRHNANNVQVQLMDVNGRLLKRWENVLSEQSLEVNMLAKGWYNCIITTENGVLTKRLLLQ